MKTVMEYLNTFRKSFIDRQDFSDDIQTSIYFIKYELEINIETDISHIPLSEYGKTTIVVLGCYIVKIHYTIK